MSQVQLVELVDVALLLYFMYGFFALARVDIYRLLFYHLQSACAIVSVH